MKEIVDYKLLQRPSNDSLNSEVNSYIKKGFQPYGTPFIITKSEDTYCAQAIVKYKE